MDEIFPLAITFPRFVRLENTRLTCLYWFAALTVLFIMTYDFVMAEQYYIYNQPSGSVQFWAMDWKVTDAGANKLNVLEDEKPYCRTPEKYEFCEDSECSRSGKEMQCLDLCTSETNQKCMELSERWFKQETSLFFPTFFQETSTRWMEDGNRRIEPSWRIVKGVEDMGIGFQHKYNVETPSHDYEEGSSAESSHNLLTILQDSDGVELGRWAPGETINLSLKQIMDAGKINLDTVSQKVRNYLDGAQTPEGILARLMGLDITLELAYYNPSAAGALKEWSGPLCRITVKFSEEWTSHAEAQIIDYQGSSRFREYQGLRIRFKATGSFNWVSMDLISNKLTQVLVFFGAVKQLVFVFTINCLGVVSKIYRGFVFQKATLGKEACGMASRLVSHTSTFVELKDKASGISEERLLRRFKRVFTHNSELDDGEIRRLVKFVFKRMAKHHPTGVDVEDFGHACTYGEALHFKTFVELFDADRKKSILERTFAGPQMRQLYQEEDEYIKEREMKKSQMKEGDTDEEAIDITMLPSGKADTNGTNPGHEADFDAVETVKRTEASVKNLTLQLEDSHGAFNDTVNRHSDLLSEHTRIIDEVQASLQKQRAELEELLGKDQQKQEQEDERQNDLKSIREQFQALKSGKEHASQMESGAQMRSEVERLKQKIEQLESDMIKPSVDHNHHNNVSPNTLYEVQKVETHTRVSSRQHNIHDIHAEFPHRTSPRLNDRSPDSRREEGACGVPIGWSLCADRDEAPVEEIDRNGPDRSPNRTPNVRGGRDLS